MNLTGKKYAELVQELVIFKPSLAISETRQAKIEVLHKRMLEQCKSRLEAFDPVLDESLPNDFTG